MWDMFQSLLFILFFCMISFAIGMRFGQEIEKEKMIVERRNHEHLRDLWDCCVKHPNSNKEVGE